MVAKLEKINMREVLSYLGCRGEAPQEIEQGILSAAELIMKTATPRLAYKITDYDSALSQGLIAGEDIVRLISGCGQIVIFGATLGTAVDTMLSRLQIRDMAHAVIFDAVASSAIENVCDNFCRDIAAEYGEITARFSAGYGDYPFSMQWRLSEALCLEKSIGITLNDSGLMLPQKSVTAIFGIRGRRTGSE